MSCFRFAIRLSSDLHSWTACGFWETREEEADEEEEEDDEDDEDGGSSSSKLCAAVKGAEDAASGTFFLFRGGMTEVTTRQLSVQRIFCAKNQTQEQDQ
eukprot:g75539.t1